MALYVSAARRTRRTVIIATVVGIACFVLGLLLGTQQTPSVSDRVSSVQEDAADAATGLVRLDIEYEQVLDGADALDASVLVPLDDLRAELQDTMDDAPWLSSAQRAVVLESIAAVRQAAVDEVTLAEFSVSADKAAVEIRELFAVDE